jgi:hypothetical protein
MPMPSSLLNILSFAAVYLLIAFSAFRVWFQPEKAISSYRKHHWKDPLGLIESLANSRFLLWFARVFFLVMFVGMTGILVAMLIDG